MHGARLNHCELNANKALQIREFALAHSGHLRDLIDSRKGSMDLAVSEDPRGHHGSDPGQLFELKH